MRHVPVLLQEVLGILSLQPGQVVIDGTLGLGGYSAAFAQGVGPTGRVLGLDLDPRNLECARQRLSGFPWVTTLQSDFRSMQTAAATIGMTTCDAVVLDLGLSSPHVDDAQRGFSYKRPGPLDMRFSGDGPLTAGTIINTAPERELLHIFRSYGQEPHSTAIVRAIAKQRTQQPFAQTTDLATCIANSVPPPARDDACKRIFQALRIAVNDELGALRSGLEQAFALLAPAGKLAVVAYHSLEDAIVKDFFRSHCSPCICPREAPLCTCSHPLATLLTTSPIAPSDAEKASNPRSRSARLRAIAKR